MLDQVEARVLAAMKQFFSSCFSAWEVGHENMRQNNNNKYRKPRSWEDTQTRLQEAQTSSKTHLLIFCEASYICPFGIIKQNSHS